MTDIGALLLFILGGFAGYGLAFARAMRREMSNLSEGFMLQREARWQGYAARDLAVRMAEFVEARNSPQAAAALRELARACDTIALSSEHHAVDAATGHDLRNLARAHGADLALHKHADPVDGARVVTLDEAREIAREDAGLVWCEAPNDHARCSCGAPL